ncbi:hypothetical protein T11_826 [Trichinella zimbabwensis]|uniref:Secreted protein n=1 Tax=Trichinella zimbabwensis TaxID=268475 RepID=A0A0V1GUZ4_9BILA|nr:hypothetical protein T11_826 [Trichinella zimbabwensis]
MQIFIRVLCICLRGVSCYSYYRTNRKEMDLNDRCRPMKQIQNGLSYIEEWRHGRHEAELQTKDVSSYIHKMDPSTERFSLVNTVEL